MSVPLLLQRPGSWSADLVAGMNPCNLWVKSSGFSPWRGKAWRRCMRDLFLTHNLL